MSNDTTITVFTTAPEAADYSNTHAVGDPFESLDSVWREVEITGTPYQQAYQCDRYRSFLSGRVQRGDPRVVGLLSEPAPSNH